MRKFVGYPFLRGGLLRSPALSVPYSRLSLLFSSSGQRNYFNQGVSKKQLTLEESCSSAAIGQYVTISSHIQEGSIVRDGDVFGEVAVPLKRPMHVNFKKVKSFGGPVESNYYYRVVKLSPKTQFIISDTQMIVLEVNEVLV